jgi:Flp pilus assembly protein TadG
MLSRAVDKNERGIAMLETVLIAPVLISIALFCTDLFFFSKSKTDLNQVTRDAAIFFAMYPGTSGISGTQSNTHREETTSNVCILDPLNLSGHPQEDIDECEHVATQERAYRLMEAQQSYLNINRSTTQITTTKTGNKVELFITAEVKSSFFLTNKTITSRAILRKIV